MAGRVDFAAPRALGWQHLALLLLAVVLGHMLSLWWLGEQFEHGLRGLPRMAEPMFTRQITLSKPSEPVIAPTPAPRPKIMPKKPVAGVTTAQKAIENIASSSPEPTPTEAGSAQTSVPEPPSGTASAPDASSTLAQAPLPETQAQPQAQPQTEPTASSSSSTETAPQADPLSRWPLSTRLRYKVGGYYRGELHGNAQVQWLREAQRYQTSIDVDVGPLRVIHMLSQGTVVADGLLPQAYQEKRVGGKLRVSRIGEQAVTLDNGSTVPRPAGVQDTASQFAELTYRFATGAQRLAVGEVIRYPLARPGGVNEWVFDVVAQDTLNTEQWGAVPAFHLKPRPLANPRGNIYAEVWFAPGLQYLPARIRITEGETVLDLWVASIEQSAPAPQPSSEGNAKPGP